MSQRIAAVIFSLALAVITSTAATAGSLTPPGAPAPTMRTMEEQKPAWNKIIPGAQRFEDALNGEAVLDKETGLVWAKTSDATLRSWQQAMDYCDTLELGGRFGWRFPTLQELGTLIDKSTPGTPKLPVGHPFTSVQVVPYYWSSTTNASYPTNAWYVYFYNGYVGYFDKGSYLYVRCVRGGQ